MKKQIKLIITDFDGTLIEFDNEPYHSSWDALGMLLSKKKKKDWIETREKYIDLMSKTEDVGEKRRLDLEFFSKDMELLKGESKKYFEDNIFPLDYTKGAEDFFLEMRYQGKTTGILSSGIDFIIKHAQDELKMNFSFYSSIYETNGFFNGKGKNLGLFEKEKYLINLCKNYNVSLEEVCYFGDHFNCIPCIKAAGLGIAVNAKIEEIKEVSDYVIEDFREAFDFL